MGGIRVAYFLVFSLIVFERLGSCAPINESGRAHSRCRKGIQEDPTESSSDWGVVALLLKGNNLSGEMEPERRKVVTTLEVLSDGGLQSCRKCLTKTIRGAIQRRLLQPSDQQGLASSIHNTPGEKPHIAPSIKSSGIEPETSKSFTLPHWAIYTLAISGAVLLVAVPTIIYLLVTHRKKDNTVMPWSTGLSGPLRNAFMTGVPSLGRAELEVACEGFINVIGTSSDYTLYKGTLSGGVEIAVVSMSISSAKDWSDRSEELFRNNISVLSRVNHKNFMNLLGYCACDAPFTRMMVFEYAPCGSLFEHLHIREAEDLDCLHGCASSWE